MTGAVQAMFSAFKPGAGAAAGVSISPLAWYTSSQSNFANTSNFTATFTGGVPSSIVWSVENVVNGSASITGGQGTATASVQMVTNDSGGGEADGSCTIRCTAVIGGVTYSGTAHKEHSIIYGGGGGGGGGGGQIP